ncbi:hypothetical protein NADFUDRAFT_77128 [Nadsonia fulvescens var. elongata DSM 6958]|uniref:Uncharacterized protein n=1 Tax=Nadsonia fulvescens var. elongata DSM 6958 TaxID=857566 RepID=A0A1E3PPD7_9ASCO|nr:hypothetical protein NADFUDRAFT_77128 [Nadsonia fulvescens var. elongata DSM 6958]
MALTEQLTCGLLVFTKSHSTSSPAQSASTPQAKSQRTRVRIKRRSSKNDSRPQTENSRPGHSRPISVSSSPNHNSTHLYNPDVWQSAISWLVLVGSSVTYGLVEPSKVVKGYLNNTRHRSSQSASSTATSSIETTKKPRFQYISRLKSYKKSNCPSNHCNDNSDPIGLPTATSRAVRGEMNWVLPVSSLISPSGHQSDPILRHFLISDNDVNINSISDELPRPKSSLNAYKHNLNRTSSASRLGGLGSEASFSIGGILNGPLPNESAHELSTIHTMSSYRRQSDPRSFAETLYSKGSNSDNYLILDPMTQFIAYKPVSYSGKPFQPTMPPIDDGDYRCHDFNAAVTIDTDMVPGLGYS